MGMRKMGIIELMMWTGKPIPMSSPIVAMTVAMATIMGEVMSAKLRKNTHSMKNTTSPAIGAATPIWMNISMPNVSSATGSPVMWRSSPVPPRSPAASRNSAATRWLSFLSTMGT